MKKLQCPSFGLVGIIAALDPIAQWHSLYAFAKKMSRRGGYRRICIVVKAAFDRDQLVANVKKLQALGIEVTGVSVVGDGEDPGSADKAARDLFIANKTAELAHCQAAGIKSHGGPWCYPWLNPNKLEGQELLDYTARVEESLTAVGNACPESITICVEAVSPHETGCFFKSADVRAVVKAVRKALGEKAARVKQLVDICHLTTAKEVGENDLGKIREWLEEAIKEGAVGLVHLSAALFRGDVLKARQPNRLFWDLLQELEYDGPVDIEMFLPTGLLRDLLGLYVNSFDGITDENIGTFASISSEEAANTPAVNAFLNIVANAHDKIVDTFTAWWYAKQAA